MVTRHPNTEQKKQKLIRYLLTQGYSFEEIIMNYK
jgi:SOS response regulatory protein OraA/RecX